MQDAELNSVGTVQKVQLDISDMQPGQIKKTRWKGKEVAVLYRLSLDKISPLHTNFKDDSHKSLDAWFRSHKPEYFVYINTGDS